MCNVIRISVRFKLANLLGEYSTYKHIRVIWLKYKHERLRGRIVKGKYNFQLFTYVERLQDDRTNKGTSSTYVEVDWNRMVMN